MENQKFLVFESKYLHLVNFEQVLETSAETTRKSLDGLKTFVKWESNEIPSSLITIPEPKQILNYSEMLNMLNSEEWVKPFPI